MTSYLNGEQVDQLLKGINPLRVGKDGKGFSHVEAYEIRAHLNRIFGFARWSADVVEQRQVFEEKGEGNRWTICYSTILRLTVCAPDGTVLATYTEGATGTGKNQPSRSDAHDLAMKTSESQALKRAAHNLGDQFGLSLWGKGSLKPIVKRTLVAPGDSTEQDGDVTEHITEPLAPDAEASETPAAPEADTDWAQIIRDRVVVEGAAKTGTARRTFLMKQLVEMGSRKLATAPVTDADGKGVSLGKLIDDAIKAVAA